MNPQLFSPLKIKQVTLKNRIVMSPMCTYASPNHDGIVNDWHLVHYSSRAAGQVGLVMIESTAVSPDGRITDGDLGIWHDEHIDGLRKLVDYIHMNGSLAAIQISHSGRKSRVEEANTIAPSAIPFKEGMKVPIEATISDIEEIILSFKEAARRARMAGFDIIELHAAHGYLINQFLSPLSNKRTDEYGGNFEKRYRFLQDIIYVVKKEWQGPLFVRVSASDYHEEGNSIDTYVEYAKKMKHDGVDLIDCSSGSVVPANIRVFPGYQVPFAEQIRKESNIFTGAVGLITTGKQAEEILQNKRADLIFVGRDLLRNPYWAVEAADDLNFKLVAPKQYERGWQRTEFLRM